MKREDNKVFMDLNLTLQIHLKEESSMVDRAENGSKNMEPSGIKEADILQVLCCVNAECPILGIKEHQEHTSA